MSGVLGVRSRARWSTIVGLLVAALIAMVFVPASAASAATATETAVQLILADTNAIRAELGLRPLLLNTQMNSVGQNWSQHLYDTGTFEHNPSFGSQIPSGWSAAGENIAAGYTVAGVVAGWKSSPGHYSNMIGDYTDIGIGVVVKNGQSVFTQDFAKYSRPGPAAAVATPTPGSAPTPVVKGSQIVDSRNGSVWVPHAVNWPSFEYACQQGWAYSGSGATDAAAIAMKSWGINAVRLPLNENCWLGAEGSPAFGTPAGYRAAVRAWVDKLNAHGIVVILDLHWTAPVGFAADGQRAMTDSRSVLFWQSVAADYKKVPSVIFDAFNEPYSRGFFSLTWSCWKSGGCWAPNENDVTTLSGSTYRVYGMSTLVSTIRKAGAKQPIMLAGIDYANDLRGWLANKPSDGQLIASWHNYPGQRCHTVACWNSEIAPVAAKVPVIASEFGETDGGSSYLTSFMNWADGQGIGYAPWAWWDVPASESLEASRYALYSGSSFTPKAPSGTAYHDHLAGLIPPTVDRVSGSDRYNVAVGISKLSHPGTSRVVYVATGSNFPDALSAAAAAAEDDAPLILTPGTSLRADIAAEIRRLEPDKIVVVGGAAVVSDSVVDALRDIQPNTVRVWGADRYAGSRALLTYAFDGSIDTVYIATGVNFPDALSASAAAGTKGAPVLLVRGTQGSLDSATRNLLTSVDPAHIVIVGGTGAVSAGIERDLKLIASTQRIGGSTRYDTSLAVSTGAFATSDRIFLATGTDFPDALGGSAWGGSLPGPLIVVPKSCVPKATLAAIRSLKAEQVTLLGGTGALTQDVARLIACP